MVFRELFLEVVFITPFLSNKPWKRFGYLVKKLYLCSRFDLPSCNGKQRQYRINNLK